MVNRLDQTFESVCINGTLHSLPQRWGQFFEPTLPTYPTVVRGIKATVYEPPHPSTRSRGEIWTLEGPHSSQPITLSSGYLEVLVLSGDMQATKNGQQLVIKEGTKLSLIPGDTASLHPLSECVTMVVKNERVVLGATPVLPPKPHYPEVTEADVELCRHLLEIPPEARRQGRQEETTSAGYRKHKYATR
jgi:hypothetical protein